MAGAAKAEAAARIAALGPWFQNFEIDGVMTAPDHFLHDYPANKWRRFAHAMPEVAGKSVLDVGCNAGFYSFEMMRRGAARVVGVDTDARYLAQARFAAERFGLDVEFAALDVYDVAALGERFDIVLFLGVLYHLRHPLLALDLLREHVVGDRLVVQSLLRGSAEIEPVAEDYDFFAPAPFDAPGFPKLHFIERRYAGDPSNWWAPNRACLAAMLRSAGFKILAQPEAEVFVCGVAERPSTDGAVYPAKGA